MNPRKVVVAGHVCLDIIPDLSASGAGLDSLLTPGTLSHIGPATISTGGAVSNVGIALHKLALDVALMGKIGRDAFGAVVTDVLHSHGEHLADGMTVVDGEQTSYTLVISPPGVDRCFLHCPGANDTFAAEDVHMEKVAGASLFHFGYPPIMRKMYADGGSELAELFRRVKARGVTTSLDMAGVDPNSEAAQADWPALLAAVCPHVDIFLPSLDEILFMLARPPGDSEISQAMLASVAEELIELGAAIVVLKLGDHGLYLRTCDDAERLAEAAMGDAAPANPSQWAGRELYRPCFQVEVAGTTGAGDCTIAGFLAGMLAGLSPEDTLTTAVAVGACNVEQADPISGILAWPQVRKRIEAGWQTHAPHPALADWSPAEPTGTMQGPNDSAGE